MPFATFMLMLGGLVLGQSAPVDSPADAALRPLVPVERSAADWSPSLEDPAPDDSDPSAISEETIPGEQPGRDALTAPADSDFESVPLAPDPVAPELQPEQIDPPAGVAPPRWPSSEAPSELDTASNRPRDAPAAEGADQSPPEMVAQALLLPAESHLGGRPVTLLTVLSSVGDRRRQIEAARAYWDLVEAVGVYRFAFDYDRQLRQLEAGRNESAMLEAARASSTAGLREAELAATARQYVLADLLMLPVEQPLPLPADPPHVGPYETQFDKLFPTRWAPDRARLIDRTLPILFDAIDRRAAAVRAAEAASTEAVGSYGAGRADLAVAMASLRHARQQRQLLLAAVCRYNQQIGEYALTIAAPGTSAEALLDMLIRPAQDKPRPLSPREDPTSSVPDRAEPASEVDPTSHRAAPSRPLRLEAGPRPTPAVRPNRPTRAVRRLARKTPSTGEDNAGMASAPFDESAATAPATTALYPGLVDAAPQRQAEELASITHARDTLPTEFGEPVDLPRCLADASPSWYAAVIAAYWATSHRAAVYQAHSQKLATLESLAAALGSAGASVSESLFGWRLPAADADRHEARAALVEAQFLLAMRTGRIAQNPWPLPSTTPHAGKYPLATDASPVRSASSRSSRRIRRMLPVLATSVAEHAAAVVAADTARAAAEAACLDGGSVRAAFDQIDRQAAATLAFAATVADYNQTIAEHALATLPPNAAPAALVDALQAK